MICVCDSCKKSCHAPVKCVRNCRTWNALFVWTWSGNHCCFGSGFLFPSPLEIVVPLVILCWDSFFPLLIEAFTLLISLILNSCFLGCLRLCSLGWITLMFVFPSSYNILISRLTSSFVSFLIVICLFCDCVAIVISFRSTCFFAIVVSLVTWLVFNHYPQLPDAVTWSWCPKPRSKRLNVWLCWGLNGCP